jgi:hypothetical protein
MNRLKALPLVYVASPYTRHPRGPQVAFEEAARVAGKLMMLGVKCFSPIAHGHPLSLYGAVPMFDSSLWFEFDWAMMQKADGLCVAKLDGWDTSSGVTGEIKYFKRVGKPVLYLDPQTMVVGEQP